MQISRVRAGLGAVLLAAVLVLPGTAASAAPPVAVDCPETRAQLAGQHITSTAGLSLSCADLHGATLDGLDLTQADLEGVDARGASFRHTQLIQAELTGADLRDAHFEDADLSQAQLDGVDARGAFFGGADLSQADLDGSDLRGADFIHASLIQADLNDTDLRAAKIYWTTSVQADVSGARVDLTNPRTFQLSLLAVVAGLVLLLRSLRDLVRGRSGAGAVAGPAAVIGISAFGWLIGGMLFPLQFIIVLYPLLAGAGLALLAGLVHSRARRRSAALGPQGAAVNPWS